MHSFGVLSISLCLQRSGWLYSDLTVVASILLALERSGWLYREVSAFEHNLERRRLSSSSSYDLNVDKPTAGREVSAFEHNLERRRLSFQSHALCVFLSISVCDGGEEVCLRALWHVDQQTLQPDEAHQDPAREW